MAHEDADSRRLAVAIGGTHVRMAWIDAAGRAGSIARYEIAQYTTLTATLMQFERESATALSGARCAVAISGSTVGETMAIARGRWTISRPGLAAVFERPAIVINEVAASAWAILSLASSRLIPVSALTGPEFSRPGRYAVVNVSAGVGLAGIDIDVEGGAFVFECEMGHCGFSPENDTDDAFHHAIRVPGRPTSWERAICLPLESPLWSEQGLPTSKIDREDFQEGLAGAFAGDAVLALGAWSGAVVIGTLATRLAKPSISAAFNQRFERQPRFERLVRDTPRWRTDASDLSLVGLGVALTRGHRSRASLSQ